MRALPFVIVFCCVYFIFKSNTVAEKHFASQQSRYQITKLNEEKEVDEHKPELAKKNSEEQSTTVEKSQPKELPKSFPAEDFIKECVNQPPKYSEVEVQILESLNERKTDIDKRSDSLVEKERLLDIATKQVEDKLGQLKVLESSIKKLLTQYNEQEDLEIQSLVKIYQAMKPKDAATIFDKLDIDILLKVISRMKETNSALIIGNMNPERAKELTMRLARQKVLPDSK